MCFTIICAWPFARKASDIHLITSQAADMEGRRNFKKCLSTKISIAQGLAEFVFSIIPTREARKRVAQGKELDIIYSFEGNRFLPTSTFNGGCSRCRSASYPARFRPRNFELSSHHCQIHSAEKGLVLLPGSTASGKSSVIASIVNPINQERRVHVITIEDPIEFLYPRKLAVIEQRQIGLTAIRSPTRSRAAFQQDPDIIMSVEMSDLETIATALSASKTGHLYSVPFTAHPPWKRSSVNRISSPLSNPTDPQSAFKHPCSGGVPRAVAAQRQRRARCLMGDRGQYARGVQSHP